VERTKQHILDAVDQQGRGLRVTFLWHRDRFAHTIAACDGDRLVPLLASTEGAEQDDWPPSPALQQLSIEDRGGGNCVALLVGMAGTSHWSVSAETQPDARRIEFDVACRIRQTPPQLVSAYRTIVAPPSLLESASMMLEVSGERCRLQCELAGDHPVATLESRPDGVAIVPAREKGTLPTTVRWKYSVTLLASVG
jgi:hypothetical protein